MISVFKLRRAERDDRVAAEGPVPSLIGSIDYRRHFLCSQLSRHYDAVRTLIWQCRLT